MYKFLFLHVGRFLKADEHISEGNYRRDNTDYNLTAPIEMTQHSRWNKQKFSAA
jgi:hypothetical protein